MVFLLSWETATDDAMTASFLNPYKTEVLRYGKETALLRL
jgi:hypothetical protein